MIAFTATVESSRANHEVDKAMRLGVLGMVSGALALIAWAALAPLGAAVVAEGTVKAQGNRKVIQHAEGGIVAAIHVKDGDHVQAGQTLITLADQRVAAGADTLRQQWASETLKTKRLEAESQGLRFDATSKATRMALAKGLGDAPPTLEAHISITQQREQQIFTVRARQLAEQGQWLTEQRAQIRSEQHSNIRLIDTNTQALKLAQRELATHEKLRIDGYISEAKILELQRSVVDYHSRVETQQTALTQARQKEADIQLRLANLRSEFTRQASDDLKESTQKLAQLQQELRPAQDAQTRQKITAPVAGEVVDLKIHTIGAAIAPREPVLDIAPSGSSLMIEARIAPQDIRDVQAMMQVSHIGAANTSLAIEPRVVHIMLTAYRVRATPQVQGQVTYVGADRLTDPASRQPYYVAHISVSDTALKQASQLAGQSLVLSAGMQTEVFLPTQERSAFRYLLDPVLDGVRRSLRER
jgi:membrane fusion protein, epimerase transport system